MCNFLKLGNFLIVVVGMVDSIFGDDCFEKFPPQKQIKELFKIKSLEKKNHEDIPFLGGGERGTIRN